MPTRNLLYSIGLGAIVLLTALYAGMVMNVFGPEIQDDPLGLVLIFFITASLYLLIIIGLHTREYGFRKFAQGDEKLYSVSLVLFSLSAHALNLTDIRVFAPYVDWMIGYILFMHLAILIFPYRDTLPPWGQYALYAVNGAGLVMSIYLCLFLGPLLLFAIPLSVALGLSLHATAPFWWALYFGQSYGRMNQLPAAKGVFWAGFSLPVIVLGVFLVQWFGTQHKIDTPNALANEDLPAWVQTSQRLPDHWLTEQVMLNKAFNQRSFWKNTGGGILGFNSSAEFTKHDPLGASAMALFGELDMSRQDLIPIMEARYDARHMTHRRLWRGNDLLTTAVHSQIDLYPTFRVAYQQMTLEIENTSNGNGVQQEAVYSFHLPPGAVATSMSLWVEGEERPSVLTTRSKADSAYETIVGRERRDPALLHWQEGNRVTITIFPCTPEEKRTFSIGFSMPLRYENDRLWLENVPFDGPATYRAYQHAELTLHGMPAWKGIVLPDGWNLDGATGLRYAGRYQPDWELRMDAPPMSDAAFVWEGKRYQAVPVSAQPSDWQPKRIFLDINASWKEWEVRQMEALLASYEVYVFAPHPIRLTADNAATLIPQLREQQFSMVPIYDIMNPGEALVISASDGNTPLLSDLAPSPYTEMLQAYLVQHDEPLRWITLGKHLAPYVQTLQDLRVVTVCHAYPKEVVPMITEGVFPTVPEHSHQSWIPAAQMAITATADSTTASAGPDHLFRLFASQQLLTDIGKAYFHRDSLEDRWLRQAEAAYIVSPVSSLLVLETDADYERFDIEQNKGTIGNAVIKGEGAAPEPHEWVLIIMAASLLLWVGYKRSGWGL